MTDSKIAIAYYDDFASNEGKCIIATISGTTPTFGSIVEFESGATNYCSIAALTDSKIAIAFQDDGDSDKGKCIIATVSGTVPSFGTTVEFEAGITSYISICTLSDSKIAIAYRDVTDSNKGKCIMATVSGTVPTFGSAVEFEAGDTVHISTCMLDEYGFAIAYQDNDDSDKGKCIIPKLDHITGDGATWSTTWPENVYDIKFGTTEIDGTGTPDTWYVIEDFVDTDELVIDGIIDENDFLAAGTDYIIRQTFLSTGDDYFDTCNIIQGLGADDEKELILTNGVDPIKLYNACGELETLDMTGDGGSAPIETAKYCAYYHGHLLFGWCNDGTNDLPQSVYWSRRGYPTYWDSSLGQGASYQDLIVNDDHITGMKVLNQRLYIFKEDSIVKCYFTGYTQPAFEFIEDKVRKKGCPWGRTIINIGEGVIYRSRENVCIFNGVSQPQDIGDKVIEYIKSIEDEDYLHKYFAKHIAKEFLYILFVPTSATTWTPVVCNYKKGSWTIWDYEDEFNTFGIYDNDVVLGDESGNVYLMDLTATDDNGTDIDAYTVTGDLPLTEEMFRLGETKLVTESTIGELEIRTSVNFGDSYSDPITIDMDTEDSIYEHVQNWVQLGEQVRIKINNVCGSQFAYESLELGYKPAGRSVGR